MKLTNKQKAILFGLILGDGYLQSTGKDNARLRLEHSERQKSYLFWKIKSLPFLFQGKPKRIKRKHPLSERTYCYYRHQSNSSPLLGKLRKIFYPEGKKVLPDLEKYLPSALALAVWYMDDGYYYRRDRCAYLYLGKVSKEEAERARQALLSKFSLFVKVLDKDKKKKGFAIYFSPEETRRLKTIILPYILSEFSYKIPPDPVTTERNPPAGG